MSPLPQLDWPKDLYSTPWKDVRARSPVASRGLPSIAQWEMWTVLAKCVITPAVSVARALF